MIAINSEELQCIFETAGNLIHNMINDNLQLVSEENFETNLHDTIKRILILQLHHLYDRDIESDIDQIIIEALTLTYDTFMPKRSFRSTFIIDKPDVDHIAVQLEILRNKPQPEQRTPDWYARRHNLITASNAYLALGSDANQNRLIYEKCQPINTTKFSKVNTDSPMHKGQKYEPLSVLIYEKNYNTHIEDFGCITHETYNFLGASPDGINCDCKSDRYGRMLEIKNIVNREITGIPKKEYWTQMQLQMETCELPECDFLETRFIEYESYEEFINDGSDSFTHTADNKEKGIIICFSVNEQPIYEYAPIGITSEEYITWELNIMNMHKDDSWIQQIYWRLDEISCILVLRNKLWFNAIIPKMQILWNTVLNERINGYEHRAPKRRIKNDKIDIIQNQGVEQSKCLILNEDLNLEQFDKFD